MIAQIVVGIIAMLGGWWLGFALFVWPRSDW